MVSGGRSVAGPAAVLRALNARRPSGFTRKAAPIALIAGVGELIGDKLPKAPSRLAPPGLAFRLLTGAFAGGALTVTSNRRSATVLAGVIGAAGAYAGSRAGAAWRGIAARRLGHDLPGALIEDVATYTAAFALVRNAFRPH